MSRPTLTEGRNAVETGRSQSLEVRVRCANGPLAWIPTTTGDLPWLACSCLAVNGNEARLVGRIGSVSGPKADNGTFEKGEYVRIGVLDGGENDKANFSPGEQAFTSCNGENPNLAVLEGNFIVEEDV